jgi:hypothetical protein
LKNRFSRFTFISCTVLLSLPLWTLSAPASQADPKTFTGEVTDSLCANSGSHDEMMAKMLNMGRDKATCTRQCAQMGAKYVLLDEATKQVYTLDDQAKAQAFAGHKVRVAGTLTGNKINVTNVEALGY